MTNPRISVIMPCFNAATFISSAIESVISQTLENWELIVINDGSTDDTEEKILRFQDARIHYFKQKNKGQCAASNFGIEKSTGSYIKFFDADDIMNAEHLEAQVKRLGGSTTHIASCAWGRFYDGDSDSAKFIPETVWKDMDSMDWLRAALVQKYDMMGAWLWLIPREILSLAGGWNESLSLNNDFEFSIRLLLKADKVLFAGDARMYYRSGMASALSQEKSRSKFEAAILSTKLGCEYLLDKENSAEMRLLCANRYQEWLFRIYPYYPDLQLEIKRKIELLGGSTRKMDGGKVMQTLDNIVGWKIAKRIKMYLQKVGYKKLPF